MLNVNQVGHYFGRLVLFRHLSVTLTGGEALAVTGANGAGKSTLLRILGGTLAPRQGTVSLRVNGAAVPDEEHSLHAGLVAPAVGVYEELTARENLRFLAQARSFPDAAARIDAVLNRVGLAGRADDRVATYSSGMQQRVKYAAALLPDPPVFLLDEPAANLDAVGREMVHALVARQKQEGKILVVATNRAEEADRHDRQLCIEDHR